MIANGGVDVALVKRLPAQIRQFLGKIDVVAKAILAVARFSQQFEVAQDPAVAAEDDAEVSFNVNLPGRL